MEKLFCDHCKNEIEVKDDYYFCEITLMSYNIVKNDMGYTLAREFGHKGNSKVMLCKDCGEKMLHGCHW